MGGCAAAGRVRRPAGKQQRGRGSPGSTRIPQLCTRTPQLCTRIPQLCTRIPQLYPDPLALTRAALCCRVLRQPSCTTSLQLGLAFVSLLGQCTNAGHRTGTVARLILPKGQVRSEHGRSGGIASAACGPHLSLATGLPDWHPSRAVQDLGSGCSLVAKEMGTHQAVLVSQGAGPCSVNRACSGGAGRGKQRSKVVGWAAGDP